MADPTTPDTSVDNALDSSWLGFYRLACGCVVLVHRRNGVRLMRRVVDAPDCKDFPDDQRFHCWRPVGTALVQRIPIHEVASADLKVDARHD